MSRRSYVYDPELGKMVEGRSPPRASGFSGIMADLPDFVSPIDGRVVHGRAGLREHNLRHGVTNAADYTQEWNKAAEKRAAVLSGETQRTEIRETLKRVINKENTRA